ncbi:hypothetical protein CMU26_01015 [Elizabethkingia anophelis]|nr:hypothetical protein [Elizabethkingia anophelis]
MSTKTKYVKVPVSERLPEKEGQYLIYHKAFKTYLYSEFNPLDAGQIVYYKINIEYWLEEIYDHSEESTSLLNRVVSFTSLGEKVPDFLTHEIEQLINKVKDNG